MANTGSDMETEPTPRWFAAAFDEIRSSNLRIAAAIERLVVLEVQHTETRAALERAFTSVEKNSARIVEIERRMKSWDDAADESDRLDTRIASIEASAVRWDSTAHAVRWVAGMIVLAALTMVWVNSGGAR